MFCLWSVRKSEYYTEMAVTMQIIINEITIQIYRTNNVYYMLKQIDKFAPEI